MSSRSPVPIGATRPGLGQRITRRLQFRLGERSSLFLIAIVIGLAGGFGAVFFRWLIGALQQLAWGEAASPLEAFARSPWSLRLAIPAIGGLIVGLLVKFLAPEAKGHGVPEVMYAVARTGGVIRPVVAVAKSLASAVCIATGGSVGREGPIVQIGSALGSTLGQWLRLSNRRIRICVGCGAAAGIAATFNTPIAAAFFASEIILGEFGTGAFASVVISSVMATVVSRRFLGDVPAFEIPHYSIVHPGELLGYLVLGGAAGIVAVAFVKTLHRLEGLFDARSGIPEPVKPAIGGLAIGCLGLLLPQVMVVGYDTITDTLHARIPLGILFAVLVAKLFATSLTLGSGGSGGIFAPSLFLGAALGGAVGDLLGRIAPFETAASGAYAVVGMGAMVAAATHAPITAILIIFEMTGDYRVILGLMAASTVATLVAQRLCEDSIYTIKLSRRGIRLHQGQEINVLRKIRVRDVSKPDVEIVSPSATLEELYQRMILSSHFEFFTVDEAGELQGVISVDDLRRLLPERESLARLVIAKDISTSPVIFVREDDTLDVAMRQFGKRRFGELPVLPPGSSRTPVGTLRRDDVINAYNREIVKVDLVGSLSSQIASAANVRTWETIGDHVVAQIETPPHLCGKTLESLKLRRERGVQVLLVEQVGKSGHDRFTQPRAETLLSPGDRIVLFGLQSDVEKLAREAS
jgi:CIC family chloride channel protein